MEYYKNEAGQIAVLVSDDYGAGWSTWNQKEIAYDKRVVEYWLAHKDDKSFMRAVSSYKSKEAKEVAAFMASIGYPGCYVSGFRTIRIEWVCSGEAFVIREYDGSEYIEKMEEMGIIVLS